MQNMHINLIIFILTRVYIADYRIFVGDLGNDVSDNSLYQAFSQYKSINKARVVRGRSNYTISSYYIIAASIFVFVDLCIANLVKSSIILIQRYVNR